MLNQKKVEIFSRKFRKSPAKQFLEIAYSYLWILFGVVLLQMSCESKVRNNNDIAPSEMLEETLKVPEIDYFDSVVVARCIRPA